MHEWGHIQGDCRAAVLTHHSTFPPQCGQARPLTKAIPTTTNPTEGSLSHKAPNEKQIHLHHFPGLQFLVMSPCCKAGPRDHQWSIKQDTIRYQRCAWIETFEERDWRMVSRSVSRISTSRLGLPSYSSPSWSQH